MLGIGEGMHKFPRFVVALTNQFDAWIIGSAADPNNNNPRDFDVVVSMHQ